MSDSTLHDRLRALGLVATADELDDLVARATEKRWGATQILEHVADLEDKERSRKSLERRTTRSRLGKFKPVADFDWNWPAKIDRPLVEDAVSLRFLGAARNIVFVAPQGLGKTMLAQNIAHQAILAGHSVLFTTAAQMLLDLGAQESSRALERRLHHYAKISLLVVDELGCAPRGAVFPRGPPTESTRSRHRGSEKLRAGDARTCAPSREQP